MERTETQQQPRITEDQPRVRVRVVARKAAERVAVEPVQRKEVELLVQDER